MRASRKIAAIALAAVMAGVSARAAAQPAQAVTVIPAPKDEAPAAQLPALDAPPDLSAIAGRPITRHRVLEGNVWDDVQAPQPGVREAGELWTAGAAGRRALAEVLATGQFARGRVTATPEGGGAALVVRVVPRKLVDKLQIDMHRAKVDYDELLHAADTCAEKEARSSGPDIPQADGPHGSARWRCTATNRRT